MKTIHTLRDKQGTVHLGVRWTGDNVEAVRNALFWAGIGVGYNDVAESASGLDVCQHEPEYDTVDYTMGVGDWLVWERGCTYTELLDDDTVRATFPVIEPGDTEAWRESIREDHECSTRFAEELLQLMDENPDLPVEWIKPTSGDGYDWMGGWQWCDLIPHASVETIARGWRHHVIIKGETEPTQMDSPDDPNLEWYRAIVVRTT